MYLFEAKRQLNLQPQMKPRWNINFSKPVRLSARGIEKSAVLRAGEIPQMIPLPAFCLMKTIRQSGTVFCPVHGKKCPAKNAKICLVIGGKER
jgi:hypothetical protein